MTAIVLAAGVGKRLLAASGGRPKCLIEIGGRSLLARLLAGLAAAGVRDAVVVTGFGAAAVEKAVAGLASDIRVRCLVNPRYAEGAILSLFTGVYAALYATGSGKPCRTPADFDWFDYEVQG